MKIAYPFWINRCRKVEGAEDRKEDRKVGRKNEAHEISSLIPAHAHSFTLSLTFWSVTPAPACSASAGPLDYLFFLLILELPTTIINEPNTAQHH